MGLLLVNDGKTATSIGCSLPYADGCYYVLLCIILSVPRPTYEH